MIHAIKGKIPITGDVENTQNKNARPKDRKPKDARPKKNTNQMSGGFFSIEITLSPLIAIQGTVEEPINPSFKSQATRAQMIDKEYESFVPIKQKFDETFNRTSFDKTYKRLEKTQCGKIKRCKDLNRVKTKQPRKKSRVREEFLKNVTSQCIS